MVVIASSELIAHGGVEEIVAPVGLGRVRLRAPALPDLPAVTRIKVDNGSCSLYTTDPSG